MKYILFLLFPSAFLFDPPLLLRLGLCRLHLWPAPPGGGAKAVEPKDGIGVPRELVGIDCAKVIISIHLKTLFSQMSQRKMILFYLIFYAKQHPRVHHHRSRQRRQRQRGEPSQVHPHHGQEQTVASHSNGGGGDPLRQDHSSHRSHTDLRFKQP